MLTKMINAMFGCRHARYSFPITMRTAHRGTVSCTGTYVVCLDCGREFAYDWQEMRVAELPSTKAISRALVTKEAA